MRKQAVFNDQIVGHMPQRETLSRLQSGERLPSALALCGQPGIGKMLVAKEFCRSLLCETKAGQAKESRYGGCGECRACRLIDGGNHPDFHLLNCSERDQASVDSIRETLALLGLKAYAGSTRLLVFDDAEQLSVQAANILLKTAEEPGANTCLLFVTANQSKLPATLLSRCQILFFNPLSNTEVATVLKRNGRHEAADDDDESEG
jgi:DNA polymerase-3 subunit delta'